MAADLEIVGETASSGGGAAPRVFRRLANVVAPRHRRFVINVGGQYAFFAAGLITPLVTLPYVSRRLGAGPWGLLVIAQTLTSFATLIITFGFEQSGTRAVAQASSEAERSAIFYSVNASRIALALAAVPLGLAAALLVPELSRSPGLLALALALPIQECFDQTWYARAIERLVVPACVEIVARAGNIAAIIAFVHGPADVWKVLAISGGATVCSNFITSVWIAPARPAGWASPRRAWRATVVGFLPFLLVITNYLASGINPLIVAHFTTRTDTAYFTGAMKIQGPLWALLSPIVLVMYPKISLALVGSRDRARRAAQVVLYFTCGVMALVAGVLVLLGPKIATWVLGPGYHGAGQALQFTAIALPLIAANTSIAMLWLMPNHKDGTVVLACVAATAVNLAGTPFLVSRFGFRGAAAMLPVTEGIKLVFFVVFSRYGRPSPDVALPAQLRSE